MPSLVADALASHPTLRSQLAQSRAASAGVDAARWQFWPTPSISVERTDQSGLAATPGSDKQIATVRLQQPLWSGGRLTANLNRAMARERIAQADVEIARQQLGLRVIQAWSDAVGAHLKVQAHRRSQRTHVQLLALVERRMSEGASARADADLAWARLELVRADLVAAQSQLDIALQRLSALVGVPTLAASSLPQASQLTAPPVGERNADAALSRALALSPQFAKAQAQKQLAQAEVESARAARWPELELRLERQFGDATGSGAAQQNRVWLGLNSSLGAGLSVGARVEEALAQLQSASDEVSAQQLALDEQIRNDLVHAAVAQERRAYLLRARQASGDVSDSWQRQFLAGRKQWQDLMNAEREVTQSEAQFADAIGAEQLSGWRLLVLTGGIDTLLVERAAISTPILEGVNP